MRKSSFEPSNSETLDCEAAGRRVVVAEAHAGVVSHEDDECGSGSKWIGSWMIACEAAESYYVVMMFKAG